MAYVSIVDFNEVYSAVDIEAWVQMDAVEYLGILKC